MKVNSVGASSIIGARVPDVQLRLDAIRSSLKQHGAAVINPDNKTDAEAIKRLQNQFGKENVVVEASPNAKLTVANFKR